MRALSGAAAAAVDAVITSPGHLVTLDTTPPILWSDIGQVTLSDGTTYTAVDMKVTKIAAAGDGPPQGIGLQISNLDSSIAALILANDLSAIAVSVHGFDRAAINVADVILLARFNITGAQIGIDTVAISCVPIFYTAPFRRVDAPNGFRFATPAGTQITWGRETAMLIGQAEYDAQGRRIR